MVRSQTQRCSVPNCMFERVGGGGEENGTPMRMAVFPKRHVGLFHKWIVAIRNPQLTGKWLRALQADGPEEARRMMTTIYNTRKICQRHFERKWIRDCSPRTSRPMLYFGAIPTKYLPDTPIPSELMKPDALVKLQNCSSFSNPMKRSRQDFVINKLIDSNTTRVIVQKNHDATIDFERIYIKDQSSSNMKSDHTYTTPDSTSSFSEALHSKEAGVKTIVANGRSVSATGTIIVPLALLGAQHSITTAPEPAGPLAEAIVPELPVPTHSSTAPGEEGLDGNGALGLYLCRVCICAEDNLILLSSVDIDNVSFKDKLKICFPDVEYEDNICNCICKICCDNLKIVYEFRQLYLKNVELLKMWKNGELSIVTGTENANTKIENCVLNPSETIIPDRVINNTHHVACTTENISTEVITTENITTESVSPSLTTGNEPQMPSEVAESVCDLVKTVSNEEPSAESNLVFFSDDVNEICIQDGLDTSQQVELMSYLNDLNGEEMDESIESYNEAMEMLAVSWIESNFYCVAMLMSYNGWKT